MRWGLGLIVLLLTSGMTCGPQPVALPPIQEPPQQTVMHFPASMDGINVLLCFEDEQPVEACIELKTLRQFVRSMRRVDDELGPGRAHGAGAPLYSAALTVPAPDCVK